MKPSASMRSKIEVPIMKHLTKLALLIAGLSLAALSIVAQDQSLAVGPVSAGKDKEQLRTLNGNVRNKGDEILPGAIVYLKNTKTLTVKSYIADDKGEFHFHALSPNVDYDVYAEFKGVRSANKKLS